MSNAPELVIYDASRIDLKDKGGAHTSGIAWVDVTVKNAAGETLFTLSVYPKDMKDAKHPTVTVNET